MNRKGGQQGSLGFEIRTPIPRIRARGSEGSKQIIGEFKREQNMDTEPQTISNLTADNTSGITNSEEDAQRI